VWYGEAENQRWIDNFHTGYNLVGLREYERATGDTGFADAANGDSFTGTRYSGWRIERRAIIITDVSHRYSLLRPGHSDLSGVRRCGKRQRVARWALENIWDGRGFFWYHAVAGY